MASPSEITPAQLARLIGTPDCPLIVDLCLPEDFALDPRVIPSAIRHSHQELESLIARIGDRRVILACQKGLKISQGAAAILRGKGIAVETLEGGQMGWVAAGLPTVKWAALPEQPQGQTRWVTRHRPKIDRIACPWLIRRFVDPMAEFLFVSPGQVLNVAEKFDATPFDIDDVFWSHRGEHCSFDTMIEEFGLKLPALDRLATIVRGADTDRHDLAPECAGLLAASLGLSRMYRDDLAQLEAGMSLYDAFYRWARDASDEGHTWPTNTK